MEVRFAGGEADEGLLNLHEGAESLSGIGRVADLVTHFVATGEVRYRAPYTGELAYYIEGTKRGSLRILLRQISHLRDERRAARDRRTSDALLERVLKRGVGEAPEGDLEIEGTQISSGTVDALTEAATPALLRAHRWISDEQRAITLESGSIEPVAFNDDTKKYLQSEEKGDRPEEQDVSVSAVNVNSRNGRVYFEDLGRTVPFFVDREANPRTLTMLTRYLTRYAEGRWRRRNHPADVVINFTRVMYPDGRLKRIVIHDCYPVADAA